MYARNYWSEEIAFFDSDYEGDPQTDHCDCQSPLAVGHVGERKRFEMGGSYFPQLFPARVVPLALKSVPF
jgi:hypothetical protein